MISYTGDFTDTYGITHTNPVFELQYANMNVNSHQGINYNKATDTHEASSNTTIRVSYGVIYWTNEAAKINGNRPMDYVSSADGHQQFTFSVESEPTDLKQVCEDHFTATYLGV